MSLRTTFRAIHSVRCKCLLQRAISVEMLARGVIVLEPKRAIAHRFYIGRSLTSCYFNVYGSTITYIATTGHRVCKYFVMAVCSQDIYFTTRGCSVYTKAKTISLCSQTFYSGISYCIDVIIGFPDINFLLSSSPRVTSTCDHAISHSANTGDRETTPVRCVNDTGSRSTYRTLQLKCSAIDNLN